MLQDLRYAARSLARMRGVAIVAILTLALGIGATTTMFGVVYAALLRPPPFAEPDRADDAVRHAHDAARGTGAAPMVGAADRRTA